MIVLGGFSKGLLIAGVVAVMGFLVDSHDVDPGGASG
jgi:hypothetical protein